MRMKKFSLSLGENQFMCPENSSLVHVGEVNGEVVVWAWMPNSDDDSDERIRHTVRVYEDGPGSVSTSRYIGTVIRSNGQVWHMFEGLRANAK